MVVNSKNVNSPHIHSFIHSAVPQIRRATRPGWGCSGTEEVTKRHEWEILQGRERGFPEGLLKGAMPSQELKDGWELATWRSWEERSKRATACADTQRHHSLATPPHSRFLKGWVCRRGEQGPGEMAGRREGGWGKRKIVQTWGTGGWVAEREAGRRLGFEEVLTGKALLWVGLSIPWASSQVTYVCTSWLCCFQQWSRDCGRGLPSRGWKAWYRTTHSLPSGGSERLSGWAGRLGLLPWGGRRMGVPRCVPLLCSLGIFLSWHRPNRYYYYSLFMEEAIEAFEVVPLDQKSHNTWQGWEIERGILLPCNLGKDAGRGGYPSPRPLFPWNVLHP